MSAVNMGVEEQHRTNLRSANEILRTRDGCDCFPLSRLSTLVAEKFVRHVMLFPGFSHPKSGHLTNKLLGDQSTNSDSSTGGEVTRLP